MSTDVFLIINTQKFTGWTEVAIKRSIETLAGSFQFGLLDVWNEDSDFGIKVGDSCKIAIGSDIVINGYIDSFNPQISHGDYTISVTGRCKCSDLIDCSAMNKPGSWNRPIDLLSLVTELITPFNLNVINEAGSLGDKLRNFSIDSGQSPFDVIRQACEMRAVLPISNNDGDIVLTNVGNQRSFDTLVYGYNILKATAEYNNTERFSEYEVKGSSSSDGSGWGSSNVSTVGRSSDTLINRYRPKLIVSESSLTTSLANERAAWEAQVRAGRSSRIRVSVVGWRQSNGELWKENTLVLIHVPPLRIFNMDMVIASISFQYNNNNGEITELLLRKPDAYKANPEKRIQKTSSTGSLGWE